MKIVITGNIGCGKSTVVGYLKNMLPNYSFFDFDATVHALYEDEAIQEKLFKAFGTSVRSQISDIITGLPEKLPTLREITDVELYKRTHEASQQHKVVLDIPLYFEHLEGSLTVDTVICVAANVDLQMERVKVRSGFSEEKIQRIIDMQLPQAMKTSYSNYTIWNTGTLEDLQIRTRAVVDSLGYRL